MGLLDVWERTVKHYTAFPWEKKYFNNLEGWKVLFLENEVSMLRSPEGKIYLVHPDFLKVPKWYQTKYKFKIALELTEGLAEYLMTSKDLGIREIGRVPFLGETAGPERTGAPYKYLPLDSWLVINVMGNLQKTRVYDKVLLDRIGQIMGKVSKTK